MAADEGDMAAGEVAHQVEELVQDGEAVKAKQIAVECVNRCKSLGNDADTALALKTLARARAANDELDESVGAINEALALYKEMGDLMGEADCFADLSKFFLQTENTGDAMDSAERARKIYKDMQSTAGVGNMLHVQSMALRGEGDIIAALRLAEKASAMLVEAGDLWTEVESILVQAQMKLAIARDSKGPIPISTLHMAQAGLSLCKLRRPGDQQLLGDALLTQAQAFLAVSANAPAAMAAKDASIAFRRSHDMKKRGRAMLVHASATARGGDWKYALKICEKATAILDEAGDEAGRENAFGILDEIDEARRASMGLPSLAQEEGLRQKALEDKQARDQQGMMYQQQMMMMAMMQNGQAPAAPAGGWKQPAQMAKPAAGMAQEAPQAAGQVVVKRDGGPLQLSAGMDAGVVRAKIMDIAMQIIGDDEPIEADMPLMQAGLTSNTAVLLRDELSKDLPGVNLPPTLMFDYPSIVAIADFVVERAK